MCIVRPLAVLAAIAALIVASAAQAQGEPPPAAASATPSPASRAPFWDDARRGWHFYEDPESEVTLAPPPKPAPVRAEPRRRDTRAPELIEFEQLQKRLERSEERRVGKECRRLCRSRWSPYH
jgi:conjugal transfer pilus assembly protein TraF